MLRMTSKYAALAENGCTIFWREEILPNILIAVAQGFPRGSSCFEAAPRTTEETILSRKLRGQRGKMSGKIFFFLMQFGSNFVGLCSNKYTLKNTSAISHRHSQQRQGAVQCKRKCKNPTTATQHGVTGKKSSNFSGRQLKEGH